LPLPVSFFPKSLILYNKIIRLYCQESAPDSKKGKFWVLRLDTKVGFRSGCRMQKGETVGAQRKLVDFPQLLAVVSGLWFTASGVPVFGVS
jgi:hypothetical protein